MEFKLGELLGIKEPLIKLTMERLPLRVAFNLQKTVKAIDNELTSIEEARVDLVKKLGEEQKDGGLQVPPEKVPEFQKQYEELLGETVDIPVTKFSFDDLGDVKITTQDMLKLEFLFDEE